MTIGIYKITCKQTGRCYIGQSKDIENRWKGHQAKKGKFPLSDFNYEIVQATSIEQLDETEIKFIDYFDSHCNGFNKTIGGSGIKNKFMTVETRQKISIACTGYRHTQEALDKISKTSKIGAAVIIVCPHCGKTGQKIAMYRWHFNNCKFYVSSGTDTISSGAQS